MLAVSEQPGFRVDAAGSGLRDATRIAAGDPALWRDVLIANRVQVLDQAARFRAELQAMEAAMSAGDAAGVEALIAPAAAGRSRWRLGG
jgi:prephenate dehydrogenase